MSVVFFIHCCRQEPGVSIDFCVEFKVENSDNHERTMSYSDQTCLKLSPYVGRVGVRGRCD